MVRDITIGQYFPGNSVLHNADPRLKLVLSFVSIVFVFVCNNFYSLALVLAFTVVAILSSRISLKVILKGLRPMLLLLIFTSALQLFYNKQGTELFVSRFITITTGGIFTTIFMVVRIICLVLLSSLLTYTTSPTQLTDGIERLLSPLKVFGLKNGVHTLAMMMTIALRFIPTLIDEIDKITNAQKARGANFETGGIVQRAKALLPIFIPLLVNSFRHAFELSLAMSARCYNGGEGRTRMKQLKLAARDYVLMAAEFIFVGGVIALNIIFESVI